MNDIAKLKVKYFGSLDCSTGSLALTLVENMWRILDTYWRSNWRVEIR